MFKKIKTTANQIQKEIKTIEYKKYLKLVELWNKKIDKKIQKNAKIIDFNNQKITIKTKNPTWKNELSFLNFRMR